MIDPMAIFPSDDAGLTAGIFKWVSNFDIADWYEVGWHVVWPTDEWTSHHDRGGRLMRWPNVRSMRRPGEPIWMGRSA